MTIGLNIGRYLGFEVAADFVETEIRSSGGTAKLGEYAI